MNDIHNNENISQEEEFVSPGQEKVNGKATPEQSGPSTGEPREQPGEPTEEAVEIEETEEIEIIEAGEFTVPKKEAGKAFSILSWKKASNNKFCNPGLFVNA